MNWTESVRKKGRDGNLQKGGGIWKGGRGGGRRRRGGGWQGRQAAGGDQGDNRMLGLKNRVQKVEEEVPFTGGSPTLFIKENTLNGNSLKK